MGLSGRCLAEAILGTGVHLARHRTTLFQQPSHHRIHLKGLAQTLQCTAGIQAWLCCSAVDAGARATQTQQVTPHLISCWRTSAAARAMGLEEEPMAASAPFASASCLAATTSAASHAPSTAARSSAMATAASASSPVRRRAALTTRHPCLGLVAATSATHEAVGRDPSCRTSTHASPGRTSKRRRASTTSETAASVFAAQATSASGSCTPTSRDATRTPGTTATTLGA